MVTAGKGPLALIILDGFGYSASREGNAIAHASMPFYDELSAKYPRTLIEVSGTCVGLPAGIMGNSEVGHLNMGAGRVIRTDIARIDHAISTGEFFSNPALVQSIDRARSNNSSLHLMGLLSNGMVHSSQDHLYALLELVDRRGIERVFIHAFLDGRDVPPGSGEKFLDALKNEISRIGRGRLATICGRYYAMDRDKRWDRTERAYRALVHGEGIRAKDTYSALASSYERGISDEFVEPTVLIDNNGEPLATIRNTDSVIFFNFRADRARQLTAALAVPGFDAFSDPAHPRDLDFVCFTSYDRTYPLPVAFPPLEHVNILADVFGNLGFRNYRFAETEKYAHVTYFFNGGVEREFPFERRLLVPSPKVATYDLAPEMSAYKITDKVLRAIDEGETDVYIINFANPDMLGHTGNFDRTVEGLQHVDNCLGWITQGIDRVRGRCIITADHGNCEVMTDPLTGQPHTAHTTNPVPFLVIDRDAIGLKLREGGALRDVAPTILGMLGVKPPAEMTGSDLRVAAG